MQLKREISTFWAVKYLSNIKRLFSGCGCELLFKIMKEVYFHKSIILARSKLSFSVKTGCVFYQTIWRCVFLPSLTIYIIYTLYMHKTQQWDFQTGTGWDLTLIPIIGTGFDLDPGYRGWI